MDPAKYYAEAAAHAKDNTKAASIAADLTTAVFEDFVVDQSA